MLSPIRLPYLMLALLLGASVGVCAPARHTLITGMYPTLTGAMAMRTWTRTWALASITDSALLAIPVYEATPPVGVRGIARRCDNLHALVRLGWKESGTALKDFK